MTGSRRTLIGSPWVALDVERRSPRAATATPAFEADHAWLAKSSPSALLALPQRLGDMYSVKPIDLAAALDGRHGLGIEAVWSDQDRRLERYEGLDR